jgi:hypothetical protein
MTRNLKALGLALFAAFALSALAASTASATETQHKIKGGANPTYLTVEQHPAGAQGEQKFEKLTNDTNQMKCTKFNGRGSIAGEVGDVTITNIQYSGCATFKTSDGSKIADVFVEFTECDYVFYGQTTETPSGTAGHHATYEIKCPNAGEEVHTKVTALKLKCATMPPQKVHGIKYTNVKTGIKEEITLNITAHGIETTTENSAACPTPEGKTVVHKTGTYTGTATVKGYSDAGHTTQSDITVTPGTT